jgi:hypothetical protein
VADDYDDQDQTDLVPRSQIRQLEQQAKEAKDLRAQLEAVQRENTFAKALGSIDHPARSYFERGYDGEMEPDAIRAAAREAGLMATSQAQTTDQRNDPTSQEMAAHARMAAASEGSGGNKPIDLIEGFGARGSKKPDEIMQMIRSAGMRTAEDMQ